MESGYIKGVIHVWRRLNFGPILRHDGNEKAGRAEMEIRRWNQIMNLVESVLEAPLVEGNRMRV